MRVSQLTFISFYINGAQDSGKYNDITIENIKYQLANKSLFAFLENKLGSDIDISILSDHEKIKLIEEWGDMAISIDEKRKFCVEKYGLCLLAYCLESIQRISSVNK